MTAISENTALSAQEKGDLRGECDLIMSFLCYNDISAMSRLHRSASAQMSRKAISIQSGGGWTFGSPSVLMMFYRAPGELQSELAEMDECMPHYYKITGNHGQGAETIMRAEAAFLQGRLTDAHIELESACARIQDNGQANMALCCDFLAWRLSLFAENYRYLKPLLAERLQTGPVAQIIELGEAAERRKAGFDRPEALSALTEREYEIVRLMAQRLNNREIAEKLYLSEGSIRQYVNQIYTKLQIAGEPRAKRKLLLDLLADKN